MRKLIEKQDIEERSIQIIGGDIFTQDGWTSVPNCILETHRLSSNAKLVYCMILRRAQRKDFCFPGQDGVGDELGMSRQTVASAIKELQTAGCLIVIRRGQGKTNIYKLPINKLEKIFKKKNVQKGL